MHEKNDLKKNEFSYRFSGFEQSFYLNGAPFPFSSIERIALDAKTTSALNWTQAKEAAQYAIERGKFIVWHFQLGLFGNFEAPFSDETQLFALKLALEHFRKTLWPIFQGYTLGTVIYQGSADFSLGFPWNIEEVDRYQQWLGNSKDSTFLKKLFCHEVCLEYLNLLLPSLPEEMLPFLLLDGEGLSEQEFWCFSSKERYPHFQLGLYEKYFLHPHAQFPAIYWNKDRLEATPSQKTTLGVCLPSALLRHEHVWQSVVQTTQTITEPFIVMSETHLAHEWDGIDEIIVFSEGISPQGMRKLRGFEAAGGQVTFII